MAATKETLVKKAIREALDTAGVHYGQPTTGGYGRSGQLDFVCCIRSVYVGIEAKSIHSVYGDDGPTALQWDEIDSISENGGVAMCVDETNVGELRGVLEELNNGAISVARRFAWKSLLKHKRPNLTPVTDTQPTIRKRTK